MMLVREVEFSVQVSVAAVMAQGVEAQSEQTLTICLWVEHNRPEIASSLLMIPLPTDLSNYDELLDSEGFMVDSNSISPVLTFSMIYFLGGHCYEKVNFEKEQYNMFLKKDDKLIRAVYALDTSKPQERLRPVASMNAPKQHPCVFVADGMIYALGTALVPVDCHLIPGCRAIGCFERYDPLSNHWEVLPDPPLKVVRLATRTWCGRATVMGRDVFIGGSGNYALYNLDSQEWGNVPPEHLADRFPYGSLHVNGSLYHLRGGDTWQRGAVWDLGYKLNHLPIHIVKRGPFSSKDACSLLESDCLDPKEAQVVANAGMLDEDDKFLFTHSNFDPWRSLIHLGDQYFCYVVTAQLVDCVKRKVFDKKCRCIGIKIFKEVQRKNKAKFQLIASFFYKLHTGFDNAGLVIRCCALGTVPYSWIRRPMKHKLERKSRPKEGEVLQMPTADHRPPDPKERDEVGALKKLLAVREEEINRLYAELARKDELLEANAVDLA